MSPTLWTALAEHNGKVDVKTAYVPGIASFAIKMSPGFFDNPRVGLPNTLGLTAIFSAQTGILQAVLLDNSYLTDVRTAAADAMAVKYLARENLETTCILGAGTQAKLHFKALTLVHASMLVRLWARDRKSFYSRC